MPKPSGVAMEMVPTEVGSSVVTIIFWIRKCPDDKVFLRVITFSVTIQR